MGLTFIYMLCDWPKALALSLAATKETSFSVYRHGFPIRRRKKIKFNSNESCQVPTTQLNEYMDFPY
jgi:hypothetical protein